MYICLIILGGKNYDMIYTCCNFDKISDNPYKYVPTIHVNDINLTQNLKNSLPFKVNINDIFIADKKINRENTIFLICDTEYLPVISYANPNGFIISDILFSREFKNTFTNDEKNKIQFNVQYLNSLKVNGVLDNIDRDTTGNLIKYGS